MCVLVCLWIQSMKTLVWGTRVHAEQRVIMLHPLASGCFAKPDTGGQACQARVGEMSTGTNGGDILWCLQIHNTHTVHTYTHTHTPSM